MNRPLYETKENLSKEADVISKIEESWNCKARKLPISYGLDFGLYRADENRIVAFAEIKSRRAAYSSARIKELGGYMLSLNKWIKAKQLYEDTGLPFLLAVELSDGIFYKRSGPQLREHLPVRWGGRKDRNDWQDQEPVVLLDFGTFQRLITL